MGDRVTLRYQVLARARGAETLVGKAARTGVGRAGQKLLGSGVVERVVYARDRARRIAKGRVRGDVLDPLAIDIDFAAITQAFQIFGPGKWPALGADGILAFDPFHEGLSFILPPRLARRSQGNKCVPAVRVLHKHLFATRSALPCQDCRLERPLLEILRV